MNGWKTCLKKPVHLKMTEPFDELYFSRKIMLSVLKKAFTKAAEERVFEYLMFLLLALFVISLPTSRAFVSITQILLFANWFLEGKYAEKFNRLRKNSFVLYLISVFFVYSVGLFWTRDLASGAGMLISKLPYLSLVFVVASSRPMSSERIMVLPLLFVAAVLFTTFAGVVVVLSETHADPRDISPFIPHIHLSMMILMSAVFLPWYMRRIAANRKCFFASLAISFWLIVFLFIMGTLSGIIALVVMGVFLLLRDLIRDPGTGKSIIFVLMIVAVGAISLYVMRQVAEPVYREINPELSEFSELTAKGNTYIHHEDAELRENGHLVFSFIAEDELRDAWNLRSDIKFDSLDQAGNVLKYTLYRYLSSKGLRKDGAALNLLSDEEIKAVEKGVPNYLYMEWPNVYVRIHQSFWELHRYRQTGNPSGHSFTQRLEVWRAGYAAAKMRPLFGWGTGDHILALHAGLDHMESEFDNFQLRHVHNQFLHLIIMFGITGMIAIVLLYYLFIRQSGASKYLPFNILIVIMLVYMLGNSPLDSQMSLNFILFFALYFGLLMPRFDQNYDQENNKSKK